MDELLAIGDFSARCGLTPKMLRSYAAAGLLVPTAVDRSSGYRYYSGSQLQRARTIALLRRARIPVAEIAAFFRNPDDGRFDHWERQIDAELSHRRQALDQARAALALDRAGRDSPTATPKKGCPMTLNLVAGSATHRGGRETNQDAVLVTDELFAVADGLGGLQEGEVASRLALQALQASFAAGRTRSGLVSACREANQAVWRQATADGHDPTMGTTVAAVGIIPDENPVVVHVGDSRLYRYRNGQLDQLTDDHSITGDLIRAGELTETGALTHPQRHILTRALGVAPDVEVDVSDVPCQPGDRLMLCSDGLFKALAPERLEAVLASAAESQHVADELVAIATELRAEDNVTAVIIDIS